MGYDPYDYYDLGEFDQKGGLATWFGSKANYSWDGATFGDMPDLCHPGQISPAFVD